MARHVDVRERRTDGGVPVAYFEIVSPDAERRPSSSWTRDDAPGSAWLTPDGRTLELFDVRQPAPSLERLPAEFVAAMAGVPRPRAN